MGAGIDADDAVAKGRAYDQGGVIFGGMRGGGRLPQALDSQLQKPGDEEGEAVRAEQKKASQQVT
jgi:hypothetical protein